MDEAKHVAEIARPQWLAQVECILGTLNEGVLIADEDNHVLFVNNVFEEMTGILSRDIVGWDAGQLLYSAEDYAALQELRQKTFRMGRTGEEFFLQTKDGQRLPVISSSSSIQDLQGRPLRIVTFTDISEQKRAEKELRSANARLQDRHRQLEKDLALAERVQQSLLPRSLVWGDIRVESYYHAEIGRASCRERV